MKYVIASTLLLSGCSGLREINDVIHPEVTNNIFIEDVKRDVEEKRLQSEAFNAYMHDAEEHVLTEAVDQLKEYHKRAEDASISRYKDLEKKIQTRINKIKASKGHKKP